MTIRGQPHTLDFHIRQKVPVDVPRFQSVPPIWLPWIPRGSQGVHPLVHPLVQESFNVCRLGTPISLAKPKKSSMDEILDCIDRTAGPRKSEISMEISIEAIRKQDTTSMSSAKGPNMS